MTEPKKLDASGFPKLPTWPLNLKPQKGITIIPHETAGSENGQSEAKWLKKHLGAYNQPAEPEAKPEPQPAPKPPKPEEPAAWAIYNREPGAPAELQILGVYGSLKTAKAETLDYLMQTKSNPAHIDILPVLNLQLEEE